MYPLQEALARDRMRERERQAQRARLAAELAAAHRWHRLARRASAVADRHERRAELAAAH